MDNNVSYRVDEAFRLVVQHSVKNIILHVTSWYSDLLIACQLDLTSVSRDNHEGDEDILSNYSDAF
jgi:hypothetical protein